MLGKVFNFYLQVYIWITLNSINILPSKKNLLTVTLRFKIKFLSN